MVRNTSVTLGSHFDEFVSKKIAQGHFHSIGEVVCAGLRRLEEDEFKFQTLKEKLQAGENSPRIEGFDSAEFLSNRHNK